MKQRVNIQVSALFHKKLKEIKGKLLIKGIEKSLTEITEEIIKMGCIDNIDKDMDKIIIKMDRRRRFF